MSTKKGLTYKEAITEIEEIMAKLERDDIDVDELSKDVSRAAFLIKYCKDKLRHTEEEVNNIIDSLEAD